MAAAQRAAYARCVRLHMSALRIPKLRDWEWIPHLLTCYLLLGLLWFIAGVALFVLFGGDTQEAVFGTNTGYKVTLPVGAYPLLLPVALIPVFLGEMISGAQINNAARQYGLAHEHALWQEFKPHFDDSTIFPWMYGKPPDGRPNDLGYFIGYRVAEAYYNRTTDKKQAIRDILTGANGNVKELLAKSGYGP